LGGLDLDREEPFQCGGEAQPLVLGGVDDGGQVFGGVVQFQYCQVRTELLVEAGLRRSCGQWGCRRWRRG